MTGWLPVPTTPRTTTDTGHWPGIPVPRTGTNDARVLTQPRTIH